MNAASRTIFVVILNLFSLVAVAQNKAIPQGKITSDGAIVYSQGNFDAPVLSYLKVGQVLPMSTKLFGGAFYKIQYAKGKFGYIADTDIQPLWKKNILQEGSKKKEVIEKAQGKARKKRPMTLTQFVGLSYLNFNYTEETMARTMSEQKAFFGIKLSGPDILISGYTVTEIDFLLSPSAPKYYETLTGKPASGIIFIGDFLLETVFPEGPNGELFFGFGPMFRYSKFNLQLANGTTTDSYSAEDMALGAVFSAGGAVRLGSVALRAEARYNWEQEKYFGYGLALQMGF